MRTFFGSLLLVASAVFLYACGQGAGGTTSFDNPKTYFSTMTTLTVEVAYEPGAEPFIGTLGPAALGPFKDRNYWDLTTENLKALFAGRTTAVTVTVPNTLAAMTAIPAQNQTSWTTAMLTDLATKYRKGVSTATAGSLFVVFVKGYLSTNGAQQTDVIGVSVTGTPVTAIFKEVVAATGIDPNGRVPKYVEQSTITHELGHALGLVNNGIPMVAPAHQDTVNGAHCTNTGCAMYYANDGKAGLVAFVKSAETSGSIVIYGSECLADAKAYKP